MFSMANCSLTIEKGTPFSAFLRFVEFLKVVSYYKKKASAVGGGMGKMFMVHFHHTILS